MTDLTEADRAKLKEAAEKATPGPWLYKKGAVLGPSTNDAIPSPDVVCTPAYSDRFSEDDEANMAFIAMCRGMVPALLAENAKLRDALKPFVTTGWWSKEYPDDFKIVMSIHSPNAVSDDYLCVGDLRRARAALGDKP